MCLDEASNIAAISDLPELATTGRGQGIQFVSIFHDLGQLQHCYNARAATIVNGTGRSCSCPGKLIPVPSRSRTS